VCTQAKHIMHNLFTVSKSRASTSSCSAWLCLSSLFKSSTSDSNDWCMEWFHNNII
jgi:hypothetical protein